MSKQKIVCAVMVLLAVAAQGALTRLVPESGISKAFTLKTDSDTEYVVRFYRPDVFRVEAAPKLWEGPETNRTYRLDYADKRNDPKRVQILLPEYKEDTTAVKFADKDGRFVFTTTEIIVTFDKATEKMSVANYRGKPIFAEAAPLTFTDKGKCTQTLASTKNVRYYGGGQQVGRFTHKGAKLLIDCDYNWAEGGAPNPAPFMMSSEGFGMMRHTFAAGEYDFTPVDTCALTHSEKRFDAFYFIGDFAKVLNLYTEATGRPNLIPMWGLELGDADAYMTREKDTKYPKQEKDGSFTETTPDVIKRVAMKYRENDMPCGWILVNDGYGCGHMLLGSVAEYLKHLNIKTGLWTEGKLDRIAWEVGTAGTRVQKLDVAWTSQGGHYKAQHALQCNADAYLGLTTNSNARAFIWTVLGWAGTQRYGICWAGDEYGGWDLIRYMIPTITGSAMSGQAYATTDIDGIFGGSNETYLRDLQWKCWTTAMYVMNGWSHMNKCPWSYPEPYKSLSRKALKDKIRLTPYFYAHMRKSWETGEPIVSPMVWNYQDDPETWSDKTKYQFMVGKDVLVAPVFQPMSVNKGWWRKGIYLPKGDWYDYNDGRRVTGGKWLKAYPIDLTKIPVFVRAGAILPMYPEALASCGSDKSVLTFDVWPAASKSETFIVYEDDGETRDYAEGAFSKQAITVSNTATANAQLGELQIALKGSEGWYSGQPDSRTYEFLVHTQVKPMQVIADGIELMELAATNAYANIKSGWYYDESDKFGTLKLKLYPRDCHQDVKVVIRMTAPVVARVTTPDYPVPSAAEAEAAESANVCKAVNMPRLNNTNVQKYADGNDMVMKAGDRAIIVDRLDGTYSRVMGHVATHPDNKPEARFTFTIYSNGSKKIFERANMKGSDVPQLIAVDIPSGTGWLNFTFTADDQSEASKSAKGVWKNVEFVTE